MKKEVSISNQVNLIARGFPGSGIHMSDELVDLLDQLRERVGRPVSISSGFAQKSTMMISSPEATKRANTQNTSRGMQLTLLSKTVVKNSRSSKQPWKLDSPGSGISSNFVHLDLGDRAGRKDGFVIWTY